MLTLPAELLSLIVVFSPLFTKPVFEHAKLLLLGAIVATGKRTVSSCLRVLGLSKDNSFQNYHRLLNRARWNALLASRILLGLIIALLPHQGSIVIGADDTIERRGGKKIKGKGYYRDPLRSTKKQVVKCMGLKWLSLMVLLKLPFSSRVWALPFMTILCRAKEKGSDRPHKTAIDILMICVPIVRRWLPDRAIVLVVDGAYAAVKLALLCGGEQVTLVTRLRMDARLYHPPAPQPPSKRGRKPAKGKRQRSLKARVARSDTNWEEIEVTWYGGRKKKIKVFSGTGLWHTPGLAPVAIRYVLVRDPEGRLRDEAFACTNLEATATEIVEWVVMRWSVEVTFEEARAHLGMETQRQWNDLAIGRTTPALLGLFSLVTLMAQRLARGGEIAVNQTAWYKKEKATFSDCLAMVRRHCWSSQYLVNSAEKADIVGIPSEALKHLFSCLAQSA